jgi:hypothetical protein
MEGVSRRAQAVLAAVSDEPTSTSDLYDRVGYVELVRVGLIPYGAFRDQLAWLEKQGLVVSAPSEDGSTLWRRPPPQQA